MIQRHPLLIQKTLADGSPTRFPVIIAPPPSDGGFIGASLLGRAGTHSGAQDVSNQQGLSKTTRQAAHADTEQCLLLTRLPSSPSSPRTNRLCALRRGRIGTATGRSWQGDSLEIRGQKGDYLGGL
ncbi:MAG: hypothetical protein IPL29_03520 [Propionivibrio sp.]|nr:hypothetical protein [Propionivibrio sp.]